MSKIYVTGHRNPDTDSIVASIAYANLRNSLGDREYQAARIGSLNDETKRLLERFEMETPEYIKNMKTQVKDLDYDHPPELNYSVAMNLAWRALQESEIASLPILNDDGTLYGVLSAGDIASYDIQKIYDGRLDNLPLFNLLSVLEGTVVNDYSFVENIIFGDVSIVLPSAIDDELKKGGIVICGNQPEVIEKAVMADVNCVIMCQAETKSEWSKISRPCIISTPLDARTVSRVIYQAMPVSTICNRENLICFHLDDYLDDVRETLLKSRYRCYPVLDENEKVVGTLSRYHLLRPRRKQVVLVDHNEASQSVIGLDEVDILEIIDHHRLADIQTTQPVSVRNEPVGSTNTILTSMYQEKGIVPSQKIAGLMAAAILSDTVMFKSPTCTEKDRIMAERLSKIARVSLEEIGKDLFSASANERSAEELFKSDFKHFHISGQNIGVAQITCSDSESFLSRKAEFMDVMDKYSHDKDLDFVILMLTDVLKEGSYLIYLGDDEIIAQAFSVEPKDREVFLSGVMSRKKQVIPMLTALWG